MFFVYVKEKLRSIRSIIKETQGENHKNWGSFAIYCRYKVVFSEYFLIFSLSIFKYCFLWFLAP